MIDPALKAIAEPNRRRILELVRDEELSAGEIASRFAITRPAVSQHLRVLREAGLVEERRDAQRRLYKARPDGLEETLAYLEGFWGFGLRRLKRAAEDEHERRERDGG
jgi:DNA-binding transcriptional ArsR family regulator